MSDIHALAGAYALDAVSDIERAAFERHLAECGTCQVEVAELRETAGRLADSTAMPAPPGLRTSVLEQVSRTRQAPPGRVAAPRSPWRQRLAVAAAAVVLVSATGGVTYAVQEQRLDDTRSEVAAARGQQSKIQAVLSAPDARLGVADVDGGGRVSLVTSASEDAGVVTMSSAPRLFSGRVYQLWMIDGTLARSVGVMLEGQTDGLALVTGARGATAFGVTAEPAGGSTKPTLPVVAQVLLA